MLQLRVINNGDHAGLIWFPPGGQPIPDCRGFGIERTLTRDGATTTSWLHNFVGFQGSAAAPPKGAEWQWPIQRYLWWDYAVTVGDQVSYRVVPVTGPDATHLTLDDAGASAVSAVETISGQDGQAIEAYFNRGVIASQWVAKALKENDAKGKPRSVLLADIADPSNALRQELGGLLRPRLLKLLADAKDAGVKVYAALYELNDPEVIPALEALGKNLSLILGNGAFKPPANDENAKARAQLKADGLINLYDRMVKKGHFAHNKFIVICDGDGKAAQVWTGSCNTTMTGLCTQANNGILIKDAAVAGAYLDAWTRIQAAGDAFPAELITENSATRGFKVDEGGGETDEADCWFAPTAKGQDMVAARALIDQAQKGILFLNFDPGVFEQDPADWTLLQTIVSRHDPAAGAAYDAGLYIRGVVNQTIDGLTQAKKDATAPSGSDKDPTKGDPAVALYDGGQTEPQRMTHEVLVPAAITQAYGQWEAELKGASSVMIHSKVVVLDPFGPNPVVMTGSHNQGMKASRANDDNLIIIQGNPALAQAYALNAIAIFQEYRWRQYVNQHSADPATTRWTGLQDNDSWQQGHLTGDQAAELAFWLG